MKRLTMLMTALVLSWNMMAENYLEMAGQAVNEGNYETAVACATRHLGTSPKDATAYFYRAIAYASFEEYGKALNDVNQAIAYYNKKNKIITLSDLYGLRAMIYEQIEEYEKALADYNTAVKKDKKNVEAYTNRAEFYYCMEEYVLAEQDYRKAAMMQPDNSAWRVEVARCLLAQFRYEDAEPILKPLIKLEPRNVEARRLLSLMYLYHDMTQEFIDQYILYLDMADNGDLNPLVIVSSQDGTYSSVIKAIARMMATTENKTYWHGVRARIYRENKHYKEAIEDLQKMEQAYGDSLEVPFLYYQMAKCYDGLYDFPKAITYYTKLINYTKNTDNTDVSLYLERAGAYCNNGEIDNALADTELALAVADRDRSFIYYLRGWIYDMARHYKASFEAYNKAIELDDGIFSTLYIMRGKNYLLHKQDSVHANADFEAALQMDTIPTSNSSRHYALMYLGRNDEAKAWMKQLLDADPENVGLYYDAACLYARMGESEKAVGYLRTALELGYRNLMHIAQDDDLDTIREREDFKELINTYTQETVENLFSKLKL